MLCAADLQSPENGEALEKLCRSYWFPVYAYVRRKGHGDEEAKDLTQSFFAQLLAKKTLAFADPARGKFRTFLLCSLNNFLANEWDRVTAQKRGGGAPTFSLDAPEAENRYRSECLDAGPAPELYDRQWAHQVMQIVLARLRAEFDRGGKEQRFEVLKGFLLGESHLDSYQAAASVLGTTEQAVKGGVLRFRRRFGEILHQEIAETVGSEKETLEEIRYLLAAL